MKSYQDVKKNHSDLFINAYKINSERFKTVIQRKYIKRALKESKKATLITHTYFNQINIGLFEKYY